MTEKQLRERLAGYYGNVPADAHAAFEQALIHRREEPGWHGVKKTRIALALALLMALLATGAYAVYCRYSVADYMRNSSQAFRDHVIVLDETYENDLFTLAVNDLVFDGETFAVTMNILRHSEETVYYLHADVRAVCEDIMYQGDIEGWSDGPSFHGGLWPDFSAYDRDPTAIEQKGFGFEGVLWSGETGLPPPAGRPVEWEITFTVFRPLWEIAVDNDGGASDERILEAWRNRQILVCSGDVNSYIMTVTNQLELPDFPSVEEELTATGAFELADVITLRFTTSFDDDVVKEELAGRRYELGEYAVVIDQLETSFQRVRGRMHVEFDRALTQEELEHYPMPKWVQVTCLDAAGEAVGQGFASPSLGWTEEDARRWEIICDFYFEAEEVTALAFRGYDLDSITREPVYGEGLSFTIELP